MGHSIKSFRPTMKSFSLICLVPFVAAAPGGYYYNSYNSYLSPKYAFSAYPSAYTTYAAYPTYQRFVPAYASQALTFKAANLDPRNNLKTGDIIADTRALSNQVQATLRNLAADPASAEIVNRIINDKDNICLGNLEDGIAGIESATKLLERAGGDIKTLIAKVKSVGALTDPATVVRAVADILRIVEPVVNKIAPENPIICAATPDQAFGSLRSLAALVDELSYTNSLSLTLEGRRQLKDSASSISAVTTFLTQLRSTFSRFEQICTPDKEYNIEAISAVGDLMINLADMFGSLGGIQKGEQIRNGKEYVNKIVAQLNKIDNLGLGGMDCSRPGDFSVAANTMEDLATIIDEVGIEQLEQQLGVDLSFVFNN